MYNDYDKNDYTGYNGLNENQTSESETIVRKKKKGGFFKKAVSLVLSAVIFGSIASGTFYGVNTLLYGEDEAEETTAVQTISLSSALYSSIASSENTSQSLDVTDIAAEGLPSVVAVTNVSVQEIQSNYSQFGPFARFGQSGQSGQTQLQETTSCGSGVIFYSDNTYLYILTNYHVVEDATVLSVTFVDDASYEAELCGYDETYDIAVIKVSISALTSDTVNSISIVEIGDSDELVVGEQVVAIGNALGYGQTVTTGIVSAVNRSVTTDSGTATYIQTDAAINPGNSGGALLNMDGELVGITTAKISSTDVEGMGYAIPISEVLDLIESLIG